MQKWEHKFIIAEKHGKGIFGFMLPREISWKIHYVNGRQQQNWTDVTLYNYLDEKGQDGWEVVSMTSHMSVRSGSLPIEYLYLIMKKCI
jgi:hypothetical protein